MATASTHGMCIGAPAGKGDVLRSGFRSGRGHSTIPIHKRSPRWAARTSRVARRSAVSRLPTGRSPYPCVRAMTDIYSQERRSKVMAQVPAVGTKPELLVRQVAHGLGYRFRLHKENLPGRPDLVFPRHRKVIFVHGCFWHGHENCRKAKRPETNRVFWEKKLSRNMERDFRNTAALKESGWLVLVVWECETRNREQLAEKIDCFLGDKRHREEIIT